MRANDKQCYDVELTIDVPAIGLKVKNTYDMKDAEYRGCHQAYQDYYNQMKQQ